MSANVLRKQVLSLPNHEERELRVLMNQIETFAPEVLGMKGFDILDSLSEVKRAGWIRKQVGIPLELAETVMQHALNVQTAGLCIIEGTPEKVQNHTTFPRMLKLHDAPEYHKILPDITPHDPYTSEQKKILERYAILEIERILGSQGKTDVALIREFNEQKTPDAKLGLMLDKLDAGVKAISYERMGFYDQVQLFHPYTLEKLAADAYLRRIYEILLEREFTHLDPHFQYFTLLKIGGDYEVFRQKMLSVGK